MKNTRRTRQIIGGLAVVGLGFGLAACDLGNGSAPNCQEGTQERLQDKLDWIYEQQDEARATIDDPEASQAEVLAAQIALDALTKKAAATEIAADACDVDLSTTSSPPPTLDNA